MFAFEIQGFFCSSDLGFELFILDLGPTNHIYSYGLDYWIKVETLLWHRFVYTLSQMVKAV